MQDSIAARAPLSGRTVALFGGVLVLAAFVLIALWLSARPPRAEAQTDGSTDGAGSQPAPTAPAGEQAPTQPDSAGSHQPLISVPEIDLAVDVPSVEQLLPTPPVTVDLQAPPVVPELPHAAVTAPGVRVSTTPPPATASSPPPSPGSDATHPPPADQSATGIDSATPNAAPGTTAVHSRATSELRPTDAPIPDGGTRAPPSDQLPPTTAATTAVGTSSNGGDFGNGLPLLAILAAGILVALDRGRRLRPETIAWLPAPWCALPERPG